MAGEGAPQQGPLRAAQSPALGAEGCVSTRFLLFPRV